jgi:hypothetical protein
VPFLRIKSEDLLGGDEGTLRRLLDFMGLRWHDGWTFERRRVVDRWNHKTDRDVDPLQVLRHPATVEAAARLGYDPADIDTAALAARYRGTPDDGRDRVGRFAS